jgi:hypothetical protein
MRTADRRERTRAPWLVAASMAVSACTALGPPPMEPLDETALETARQRWAAHGSASYHLVVRVRAPRTEPVVYDVTVAGGTVAAVARNGERVRAEEADHYDYSVSGLFDLLRTDLRWTHVTEIDNTPAVDLRARFEPETGRLVRYRRTVGTGRRRVLLVEVLSFEPECAGSYASLRAESPASAIP